MLWHLLGMTTPPAREWWLDAYVEAARGLEGEKDYRPRGGQFQSYVGPLWQFVLRKRSGKPTVPDLVLDACNRWFSGAYSPGDDAQRLVRPAGCGSRGHSSGFSLLSEDFPPSH